MTLKPSWLSALLLSLTASTGFAASAEDREPPVPLSADELGAKIDGHIEVRLGLIHGIDPAPLADDAEFMRRVYLDLIGRIPTEAEARNFLADRVTDRRARLVEALLESPLFVRHMSNTWQSIMAPLGSNPQFAATQPLFRSWLEKRVQANVAYDVMVRELITAPMYAANLNRYYKRGFGKKGISLNPNFDEIPNPKLDPTLKLKPNPNPNFNPKPFDPNPFLDKTKVKRPLKVALEDYEDDIALVQTSVNTVPSPGSFFFDVNEHKPENLAASVSRQFMGVRLECAQCHNHPSAAYTRKQFWEFAAFFTGTQPTVVEFFDKSGERLPDLQSSLAGVGGLKTVVQIQIPGTDKIVQARFLDGKTPEWKDNIDSRQLVAQWLTAPSNPYFARTAANRLWAQFFGTGIIDPVDDEPNAEHPASHPDLLAELSTQFVAHQYDVKYLIRAITSSRAYQRASAAAQPNQNGPRMYARMAVKGLTPDQLFDNLAVATGFQDPNPHQPGIIMPNTPRGDFLLLFANRDAKTETQTSILQALALMNGKMITDATSLTGSRKLAGVLNSSVTTAEKIESLYLSTLSRLPRSEEAARMLRYVDSGEPGHDARAALGDVFWALLNSAEFRFNH